MNSKQASAATANPDYSRDTLRLISFNVQVGISTARQHDYFTGSWKHVLPHPGRGRNLRQVAELISAYDVVGLQELDSGSLRSGFVNQAEYLARLAGFPYWIDRTNRNLGLVAQHSMGLLSRLRAAAVERHALPGRIPGRGALLARFGQNESLVVAQAHLALSKKARLEQVRYLTEVLSAYRHVVLMGDFNCEPASDELEIFRRELGLRAPAVETPTYPSWAPRARLDHILVSSEIGIVRTEVVDSLLSDHRPLAMEIGLPAGLNLRRELARAA